MSRILSLAGKPARLAAPAPSAPPASSAPLAREAPAPDPMGGLNNDAAHQTPLNEPILDADNIQGNILAGFSKDNQVLIFLQIDDVGLFRAWLFPQVAFIASLKEVLTFNRLFKEIRFRRGRSTDAVKSTWLNIAFSHAGLTKLSREIPDLLTKDFLDQSFKNGLSKQSASLGDPTDPKAEGHPDNWLIGGTNNEADVVLIVGSDDPHDLDLEVARIEQSIQAAQFVQGVQVGSGAHVIFKQPGANLPAPIAGHEHFGFLDGVSQPGVRGLVSDAPHDVLMLRQNPHKRDNKVLDPKGNVISGDVAQGKPGQDLLWPGEFVFGYLKQNGDPAKGDIDTPSDTPADAGPDWARNGSFLVFRRLRQDVFEFHRFLNHKATENNVPDPGLLGAKLVGRWRSGAPAMRTSTPEGQPEVDIPALGDDDCANNNFEFQDDLPPITTGDIQSEFDCLDDKFPTSPGDQAGTICPFSAHIRKSYPRNDTDPAVPPLGEVTTQTHRLLRRGIPFGPISPSTPMSPVQDNVDRGLVFLAYQTSIENQFEFVTQNWVNNADFKRGGVGHDPIIGQNPNDPGRVRTFQTLVKDASNTTRTCVLDTKGFGEWVIPTGGGYFFSPALDVLQNKFAKSS